MKAFAAPNVVCLLFAAAPWAADQPPRAERAKQPGVLSMEFFYEKAPFPSCHASTIAETRDGLAAAWFGGTNEGHADVGIWLSRKSANGPWSEAFEVANGVQSPGKRHPCWNPVLFQPKTPTDAPLLLFYKVGPNPSTWWGLLMSSRDGGQTWSAPQRLPEGFWGPIKNKPVQLENGDILCPTSSEHAGWRVHFERTPDLGKSWSKTDPLNDGKQIGAIQPSILFHSGGKLQALGRSQQGRIWEAWSDDQGKTWGAMTLTALPNPNSGTDAATLADGRHVLVYNHTAKGRSPLNVAVSRDGKAWQAAVVLEDEPGEYSYPAVIQTRDGLVHITYTWRRQRIRHVVLDPAKLVLKDMPGSDWPK
jgi:predicted neuraminidase